MDDPRRLAAQVRRMLREEEEVVDPDPERRAEQLPAPGEVSEEAVRAGLERLEGDQP